MRRNYYVLWYNGKYYEHAGFADRGFCVLNSRPLSLKDAFDLVEELSGKDMTAYRHAIGLADFSALVDYVCEVYNGKVREPVTRFVLVHKKWVH